MVKGIPTFTNDLEEAVSFFRPILQRLSIRQETTGFPVFLSAFPQLWGQKNINKWVVTLLKTDLRGCRAKFMSQYHQQTGIMECYIILDNALFTASGIPNETRKAVAVHEFCHFVALIYAGICTTEEILIQRLMERLSKIIDELTNDQVVKLYRFLNTLRPFSDEFATFEQTRDDHFRLNCEDLDLSYSDLFKNFLISRQMFDEYFDKQEKENFFNLLNGKPEEAYDVYTAIAKRIAKDKWLPEKFAINQAIDILIKFYLKGL